MPKINISEIESYGLSTFDATENVVLVPIFFPITSDGVTAPATKLYDSLSSFEADYGRSAPSFTVQGEDETEIEVVEYSFNVIEELINMGLKVIVKPFASNKLDITDIGAVINEQILNNDLFEEFRNKNLYNIKFITTGYWTNFNIGATTTSCYSVLTNIAAERGDCIALVEPGEIAPTNFVSAVAEMTKSSDQKFAAMTYPKAYFTLPTTGDLSTTHLMPGTFGYLMAFANSVRTNADWFAASGIIRGAIPNLTNVQYNVTEAQMHVLQGDTAPATGIKVNVIMPVGTYGIRLWGNRVMGGNGLASADSLQFSDFLNVRVLLCDIKKQIYHAALRNTFEPNDDITWINFKRQCNTLLDQMQSGRGINWYSWRREETDQKATIKATLTIRPIEAVEYFDIGIILTDEEAVVEEI